MSYRGTGDAATIASREEVTGRLVTWLGEERRAAIEAMVDEYIGRFEDGGSCCESALAWSVHVAKGHTETDIEMALNAAEALERIGFDAVKLRFLPELPCRECETASSELAEW